MSTTSRDNTLKGVLGTRNFLSFQPNDKLKKLCRYPWKPFGHVYGNTLAGHAFFFYSWLLRCIVTSDMEQQYCYNGTVFCTFYKFKIARNRNRDYIFHLIVRIYCSKSFRLQPPCIIR